ncbi:hypothetical protein DMB66_44540 [Actinoplanes sp. ATCC 53533]|uniref:hypothetical protein n=1 Tax=Actinoplanes sp. ATCC 53533 TaxID=1288362 RepID=UPI000F7939D5|nr:hypothetical protein [Actinoplanes sp. ATCC 53533]RSM49748.1 hypothetical protein DMB66_44540 [Actinoplanes sp. ATCC 53533]
MAEEFEELFAGLRADTMRQIRPPGAELVRRTVRRRRTTTVVFAGVLLVVLGGTVALLCFPSRPTTPAAGSEANDPATALGLPDQLPAGSGWGAGGGVGAEPFSPGWQPLNGDFRLAVACAGTGTLHVTLRQARSAGDPSGTIVNTTTYDLTCQHPPRRQDVTVGVIRNLQVDLILTYEAASPAPASFALRFLPR